MRRPTNRNEIRKVHDYVDSMQKHLNRMRICPRAPFKYPFDVVGIGTLSKVFALSKACLALLSSGFPDEAFALSRSIVEAATNLRYLTADPDLRDRRTRDFVKYAKSDKAFWAHYALEQFAGKKEEREIREYAKSQGIVPDTKAARRHWSGLNGFIWDVMNIDHPLAGPVTPKHKKASYAADYFHASSFVHCSLPAIDNYYVEDGVPARIACSSGLHETDQPTLFIISIYLHASSAYALFGMGLDRPTRLNKAFQRTLKKLRPVARRRERR
ncbi:MAG: hypothetical protein JWM83_3036 [Candidatus Angelobacter sp.]|nr:hypothetical protein [Candidatus Angelobacter sp.]